jgi:hypothetical protein
MRAEFVTLRKPPEGGTPNQVIAAIGGVTYISKSAAQHAIA